MTWDGTERRQAERRLRMYRGDTALFFSVAVEEYRDEGLKVGTCDAGAFMPSSGFIVLSLADLLALAGFMRRVAAGDTKTEA